MTYESKISNIIVRLKEYRAAHPEYTLQKIADHTGISFSTVSRIFAEGSENQSFRYDSIQPIVKMLLDLDDLGEGNDDDKAYKAIIQFYETALAEAKVKYDEQKQKYEEKLDAEREQYNRRIDFLTNQVSLKDDRISRLLTSNEKKDIQYEDLHQRYVALLDIYPKS